MRKFEDNKNNLIWVDYHSTDDNTNKSFLYYLVSRFSKKHLYEQPLDVLAHNDAINQLNTWQDLDKGNTIKDYILHGKSNRKLGDYFENKYFNPSSSHVLYSGTNHFYQYFAYRPEKNSHPRLVGTVLINHCDDLPNFSDYIEYIVVNPEEQQKGNGSQMILSILENPTFFTKNKTPSCIVSYIRNTNKNSIKTLLNLGFKKFYQPESIGLNDEPSYPQFEILVYDFKEHNLEKEN